MTQVYKDQEKKQVSYEATYPFIPLGLSNRPH